MGLLTAGLSGFVKGAADKTLEIDKQQKADRLQQFRDAALRKQQMALAKFNADATSERMREENKLATQRQKTLLAEQERMGIDAEERKMGREESAYAMRDTREKLTEAELAELQATEGWQDIVMTPLEIQQEQQAAQLAKERRTQEGKERLKAMEIAAKQTPKEDTGKYLKNIIKLKDDLDSGVLDPVQKLGPTLAQQYVEAKDNPAERIRIAKQAYDATMQIAADGRSSSANLLDAVIAEANKRLEGNKKKRNKEEKPGDKNKDKNKDKKKSEKVDLGLEQYKASPTDTPMMSTPADKPGQGMSKVEKLQKFLAYWKQQLDQGKISKAAYDDQIAKVTQKFNR